MTSKLNSVELYFYFSLWIFANLFSLFKLFQVQSELFGNNEKPKWPDLVDGWSFLSRHKDVSDLEWSCWKYFFQRSWYYLIFQFVISEMIRTFNIKYLKYWYILSSIIYMLAYTGIKQMSLVVFQPIIYLAVIWYGGGKIILWMLSISLLFCFNVMKYKNFFWDIFDAEHFYDEEIYLTLVCTSWIELRCISFCIDYIDVNHKLNATKIDVVTNMLSYIFYLPLMHTGPIVLYENFEKSLHVKRNDITKRMKRFICDMILFSIYTFLLDLAFHYIYFYAMQNEIEPYYNWMASKAITDLPTMALCGGGLWMGLEFHMKYVIFYGTTSAFARLDNIEAPPNPRCIARVHVYSHMWRYFDVGLYKFLIKYIYKPSLSAIPRYINLPVTILKLTASFFTFIFIFFWHGTVWDIFVWSALNFIGITLEQLGKSAATTETYKWFKKGVLRTDEMEIRFLAMACTPLLIMSAISNFYLFAGSKVANIFFACFLQPSSWNSVIVTLAMYSCCHVSIALQNVPSRTYIDYENSNLKPAKL
ncbi:protein-cysteine N-palmitoyltransferase Rasp isoform X1 [Cydia pomonella]|uniref:protein-cysteine N-palmitoyltransferase Rasp isoform X1 n=2 Tax=Cydia pomonella TaxID=82600 RepID=UPI002ADDDB69|nr:protein-cysteine N-palmitoyltransferase Rasp isoform X1 [Cydia pomonella]